MRGRFSTAACGCETAGYAACPSRSRLARLSQFRGLAGIGIGFMIICVSCVVSFWPHPRSVAVNLGAQQEASPRSFPTSEPPAILAPVWFPKKHW
eukprot:422167-Pyramimonas_sp.AAC.1